MEELIKIMKIEKKGQPRAPKKEPKVKPKKPKTEKGLKPVAIEREPKVIIEKPKRIKKPKVTHIEKKRIKIQENLDAIQAKADAYRITLSGKVSGGDYAFAE
jgi:hypothetical protein